MKNITDSTLCLTGDRAEELLIDTRRFLQDLLNDDLSLTTGDGDNALPAEDLSVHLLARVSRLRFLHQSGLDVPEMLVKNLEKTLADILAAAHELTEKLPDGAETLFRRNGVLDKQMEEMEIWAEMMQQLAGEAVLRPDDRIVQQRLADLGRDYLLHFRTMSWLAHDPGIETAQSKEYVSWKLRFSLLAENFQSCRDIITGYVGDLTDNPLYLAPPEEQKFVTQTSEENENPAQLLSAILDIPPTKPNEACPDDETLHRYALAELADPELFQNVHEHCTQCTRCTNSVVEIRAGIHAEQEQRKRQGNRREPVSTASVDNDLASWLAQERQKERFHDLTDKTISPTLPLSILLESIPQPLYAQENTESPIPVLLLLIWKNQEGILGMSQLTARIHYFRQQENIITISGSCLDSDMAHIPKHASLSCKLVLQDNTEINPVRQHPDTGKGFSGDFSCTFEYSGSLPKEILIAISIDMH